MRYTDYADDHAAHAAAWACIGDVTFAYAEVARKRDIRDEYVGALMWAHNCMRISADWYESAVFYSRLAADFVQYPAQACPQCSGTLNGTHCTPCDQRGQ